MALHYFHTSNGTVTLDPIGVELDDLTAVRKEAVRAMRELLSLRETADLWAGDPWKVWVTDMPNAAGQTIPGNSDSPGVGRFIPRPLICSCPMSVFGTSRQSAAPLIVGAIGHSGH
jgi:hypothetical protein